MKYEVTAYGVTWPPMGLIRAMWTLVRNLGRTGKFVDIDECGQEVFAQVRIATIRRAGTVQTWAGGAKVWRGDERT